MITFTPTRSPICLLAFSFPSDIKEGQYLDGSSLEEIIMEGRTVNNSIKLTETFLNFIDGRTP